MLNNLQTQKKSLAKFYKHILKQSPKFRFEFVVICKILHALANEKDENNERPEEKVTLIVNLLKEKSEASMIYSVTGFDLETLHYGHCGLCSATLRA